MSKTGNTSAKRLLKALSATVDNKARASVRQKPYHTYQEAQETTPKGRQILSNKKKQKLQNQRKRKGKGKERKGKGKGKREQEKLQQNNQRKQRQ